MPPVVNKSTKATYVVPDDVAQRLVQSGEYDLAPGSTINAAAAGTGNVTAVDSGTLTHQTGLAGVSASDAAAQVRRARLEDEYGGVTGGIGSFARGFGRGISFGLYQPDDEAAQAERELHPWLSGAGEIGGILAPALVTGGATLPESGLELGAEGLAEVGGELGADALGLGGVEAGEVAARAPSSAARVAQVLGYSPAGLAARGGRAVAQAVGGGIRGTIAEGAVVGTMQSAGNYLGAYANGDPDLSAEGFLGAMGQGALWGAAGGALFGGAEHGFTAANKLFPRIAGTSDVEAIAAEQELGAAAEGALDDGDALYAKAKQRMTDLRVEGVETDVTTKKRIADIRVAEAEHKLAARKAIDDVRLAKATAPRAERAPRTAPQPKIEMPSGWTRGPNMAEDAPVAKGIPSYDELGVGDADGQTIHVTTARDLLESGRLESPGGWSGDANRLQRVREGMQGAHKFEPIDISMDPTGRMDVVSGRHRLVAAATLDRPVAVRFWRGQSTAAVDPAGMADAASAVGEQMSGAANAEGSEAMRATSAEHATVADAVEEYTQARTNVREWIQKTRAKAAGGKAGTFDVPIRRGGWAGDEYRPGPEHGRVSRTYELHDSQGNVISRDEWLKQRPDEVIAHDRPYMGNAGESADLREEYEGILRRAAIEPDPTQRAALIKQAADLEDQALASAPDRGNEIGSPSSVRGARERLGLSSEDVANRRLARHERAVGGMKKIDDVVKYVEGTGAAPREAVDIDEAAKVLNDFERAHAKLADVVGADSEGATKRAADFRAAEEKASAKVTARHAQVAEDVASAPLEPPPAARRVGGKAAAVPVSPTPGPVGAAGRAKGLLRKASDIGQVVEVLHSLGIPGIPDLRKLPVIGPLLSLYLKAKVARRLLGKFGGKVGQSVEGEVATRASATRDRVAAAVDGMLSGAAAGARAAAPASGALAVLGHRLYDDGTRRDAKPGNARQAARDRARELAAAVANPDGVQMQVRRAMRGAVDPDVVTAIEAATWRKLSYLATHAPKEPPPSILGGPEWLPSGVDAERFARRVRAAEDPASVIEDALRGVVTPEGAETLRTVYPRLFAEAGQRLLERTSEPDRKPTTMQQAALLSSLFGAPLVASLRPESQAEIQAALESGPGGAAPPQPMPPQGNAPDLSNLFMSSADRRLTR